MATSQADSSGANTHGRSDFDFPSGGVAFERAARDNGAGEFSYGAGLDVPGNENAPVSEGGRYRGQSPPTEFVIAVHSR